MLILHFLGKPQLIHDGTDVTAALGGKACALLCFLFLRREKYISREKIAAYLWPDSTPEAARYNMRYNLWMIKKFTKVDEAGRSLILMDRECCGINEEYNYACDIQQIAAVEAAEASLAELQGAHALFRGDLLEGCYFNNCDELNELILNRRLYFEKLKTNILMRIAQLYEEDGQLEAAIGIFEELMENEPYHEQLALRLMSLYADSGNRSGAISFYHSFCRRLSATLEIAPDQALYEKYLELRGTAGVEAALSPQPQLSLDTYGVSHIPCFWMSDAAKKVMRALGNELAAQLQPHILPSLASIQPELLTYTQAVAGEEASMAAIGNCFIELVTKAAACTPLTLNIRDSADLDQVSAGIIKYLQHNMPLGLTLNLGP